MALNTKSPWDEKFLREQPFMAFGSMMNAYGRVNEGKGTSIIEFEVAANKMFNLAQQYAIDAFKSVTSEKGIDIPVKANP